MIGHLGAWAENPGGARISELNSETPHVGALEAAGLPILASCLITLKIVVNGILQVFLGAGDWSPLYLCSGLWYLKLGSVTPSSGQVPQFQENLVNLVSHGLDISLGVTA